ncbi:hypothetical protein [Paenibacillus sp. KS-LC4]|uniref:hypothetical protein n=1 Tax=Paenibacillus sp. KS-LC4 TaxID=2979727 RepID=UPI0030D489A7
MWERTLVVAIFFGGMFLYDSITLRGKMAKKDKWIYALIVAACLYMAIDYVVNKDWLDYFDVVEQILNGPAQLINNMLGGPG